MEKKYLILGYGKETDLPIFYDEEAYSLRDAVNKAKEYFEKFDTISKIILFEQRKSGVAGILRLL